MSPAALTTHPAGALAPAGPVPPPEPVLLSVRGARKGFGGVMALRDVDLEVRAGRVTAVIGPNGAGKTTLFNCMTGFGRPDAGEVRLDGQRVDRWPAHRIAKAGVVRTFQSIRMFPGLTVFESLLVPASQARRRTGRDPVQVAGEVMDRLGLAHLAARVCTELPLLAQRRVEVGRALAVRPRVMLLDEPTAGATAAERDELADLILELKASGETVVVIEHHVPFVLKVSDHVMVLNFGEVVTAGRPKEVAADDRVREVYLG